MIPPAGFARRGIWNGTAMRMLFGRVIEMPDRDRMQHRLGREIGGALHPQRREDALAHRLLERSCPSTFSIARPARSNPALLYAHSSPGGGILRQIVERLHRQRERVVAVAVVVEPVAVEPAAMRDQVPQRQLVRAPSGSDSPSSGTYRTTGTSRSSNPWSQSGAPGSWCRSC